MVYNLLLYSELILHRVNLGYFKESSKIIYEQGLQHQIKSSNLGIKLEFEERVDEDALH
jgi:hypothetical protein